MEAFQIHVGDPLVKPMPDSVSAGGVSAVSIDAVRNEYESGMVLVTASRRIERLTARVSEFSGAEGPKPRAAVRFVGTVPIVRGTTNAPSEKVVARAPADIPDPLLDVRSVSVEAGQVQPVWLTVFVPMRTQPGDYRAELEIAAEGVCKRVQVVLSVHPVTLPKARTLFVTNWFSTDAIAKPHGLEPWSEPFWKMLRVYAKCMAEHRQNVVLTPITDLIRTTDDGQGNLSFDFAQFDRWIELFIEAGVADLIEGGHLADRLDGWESTEFHLTFPQFADQRVAVSSQEARRFLSQFLPALQNHLDVRGWTDRYLQHLADEPIPCNAQSYRLLSEITREFAPKLRIMDACMCSEIAGAIDVLVPQPEHFEREMDLFAQRQKLGEEVWFYTCLSPKGMYMNRFLDYPLIDVRLLHWMNFKYRLTGYLHWGLNQYSGDPFKDIEPAWLAHPLPPGDTHIVYPGKRGPLSSIRFEAMRDGLEDYELLKMLEAKDPKKARAVCDSVVRSLTDYELDPAAFRRARLSLIEALS